VNDGAYAVTGTCSGSWSVDVTVGTASGSAPCSGGVFTVTLDVTALPDAASVAVTATQGNAAGTSVRAATTLKDAVAAAPVVLAPAANATVAPSPSVSGLAEPGATVTVTEGATLCTATADGFGNWSCTTSLGAGAHTVSAHQVDAAGNTSGSASRDFTVDVAVPVVALGTLDVIRGANVAAYPVDGACTAGSGDVTVSVGSLSRIVPCVSGAFATTLDVRALAESPSVTVSASQTFGGRTGSDVRTTPQDSVAHPPAIVSPAAGGTVAAGPALTGTAEPLATLTVTGPASGLGGCAAPFAADATGAWSCSTALALGPHSVSVSQTDLAGNVSVAATRSFTVVGVPGVALDPLPDVNGANAGSYAVVGTCDPAAGDVTVTAGGVVGSSTCGGTFAVALDLTGEPDAPTLVVSAAQTNVSGTGSDTRSVLKDTVALAPAIASPAAGGTVAPNPVASGTAEPGAGVTVSEAATLLCAATADDLGRWSCPTSLSGAGAHTIDAVQTDRAGNESPASSRTFTVTVSLPSVGLSGLAVINGANAGAFPVAGTCTAGDGDVTITVGSASPVTTGCIAAGSFAADVSTAGQPDAAVVTVTASQTNGSGTGSAALTTLKDTVAAPPVVTSPAEGADVPTPRPAIAGTAEPGALVIVQVGGTEVGRATADGAGDWSVTPASDLGPGSRTASVTQLDLAGNTSAPALRTFSVDTGTAPTVTLPAPFAVIDYDRPIVFAGLAAPGATVTVAVDGAVVGAVTADGAGAWTLTVEARTIAVGLHAVTATADGLSSAPVGFTIRLPETELTGGGCGCQGGGGAGGWLAILSVLGVALRRRPRRVNLSA
jgi:MYXO-CTERM domain-containing protein